MAHTKPIIFFSHSSRDKAAIATLRTVFGRKTGNTINVFASSDGQSIPFGKNWVHEVEEALRNAKLMFVFLTPDSVRSQWVSFEAGYAYGRELHVVPIGMWGVDIETVGPPLSLLQGFNVTSRESLSNIIAISNREFGFAHDHFTPGEYTEVVSEGRTLSALGEHGSLVDDVESSLDERDLKIDAPTALRRIGEIAKAGGGEAVTDDGECRVNGLSVTKLSPSNYLSVKADPGALATTIPMLNSWLKEVREGGANGVEFRFVLVGAVGVVSGDHKISGRLASAGVRLSDKAHGFRWNDLVFSFDRTMTIRGGDLDLGASHVIVSPTVEELPVQQVSGLFDLLFDREILFVAG